MKEPIKRISQVTQEVTFFLRGLGFSNYYIIKIFAIYGDATISLVEDNPYFLLEDFPKIGFKKIDEISLRMGNTLEDNFRIEAGIKYVLGAFASEGHSYANFDDFIEKTANFLDVSQKIVRECVEDMAFLGEIQLTKIDDKTVIYFYPYYKAECEISKRLISLKDATGLYRVIGNFKERINNYECNKNIELSENQRLAILSSIGSGISIITGGPGTGKTTVIESIVDIFESSGMKVALTAPTGRAAKRIMETSKHFAQTIHRLLGYYYDDSLDKMIFSMNEDNPLNYQAVIVDEASMMDLLLTEALLRALKPGTRLILVGDVDQLPSVGAGNVLADMIDSECFQVTKLNRIYRQGEESNIITNAHRINEGDYPKFEELKDDIDSNSDFLLVRLDKQDDISNRIIDIANRFDSNDVQVLTPIKKGKLGTSELNDKLHDLFNPKDEEKDEIPFGKKYFRVGDRVMQIKNNYRLSYMAFSDSKFAITNNPLLSLQKSDLESNKAVREGQGVFNGEIGVITGIDKEERSLNVLYDNERFVKYEYTDLDEIEHAYAITIHKSQGSEFPIVIIPMSWFPPIISTRSLIYTGITRGKKKVIIVGNPNYMNAMVDNNQSKRRNSGLKYRLTNLLYGV